MNFLIIFQFVDYLKYLKFLELFLWRPSKLNDKCPKNTKSHSMSTHTAQISKKGEKNVVFPANMNISVHENKEKKRKDNLHKAHHYRRRLSGPCSTPEKPFRGEELLLKLALTRAFPHTHTYSNMQILHTNTHTPTESDGAPGSGYPHTGRSGKLEKELSVLFVFFVCPLYYHVVCSELDCGGVCVYVYVYCVQKNRWRTNAKT